MQATLYKFERKYPRVMHGGPVIYKGNYGFSVEADVRDVSSEGCFIISDKKVRVGQDFLVFLPVILGVDVQRTLILSATVVRNHTRSEHRGFAVTFNSDTSKRVYEQLKMFVEQQVKKQQID